MKTRIIPSVFAAIAVLAIAFGMSAFKGEVKPPKKEGKYTTFYFRYVGADNEAAYENKDNWSVFSGPGSDPCSGDNEIVCVLNTNDLATGTTDALDTYLGSLADVGSEGGAEHYCRTTARKTHEKPTP